jgi:hypothetical protein
MCYKSLGIKIVLMVISFRYHSILDGFLRGGAADEI